MERLADDFPDERALTGALEWLRTTLALTDFANEAGRSTARISELVEAIKEHTCMDRGSYEATDVREGLESTVTILGHKLKGAKVMRNYEEELARAGRSQDQTRVERFPVVVGGIGPGASSPGLFTRQTFSASSNPL